MSTKAPYSIRWWLIRHAPVINPDDVAYGSMDLDATFEAMGPRIEYLRAMLPSPANVRTSALVRSQQTLHSVWPDAEIYPDAAWNEQSLGAWEGQPRSVIYGPNGPVRALFDDPKNFRPPSREDGTRDGESWLTWSDALQVVWKMRSKRQGRAMKLFFVTRAPFAPRLLIV